MVRPGAPISPVGSRKAPPNIILSLALLFRYIWVHERHYSCIAPLRDCIDNYEHASGVDTKTDSSSTESNGSTQYSRALSPRVCAHAHTSC